MSHLMSPGTRAPGTALSHRLAARADSESRDEIGRQLGHDMYRGGIPPGVDVWAESVREGYAHARMRERRHAADRHERKWLQLRLNAHRRDRVVDAAVTPELLRRIDVAVCPVTRVVLTHGARAPSDWSVDRLNNDGAYAASNLAVMSVAANRAKGRLLFADVLARAQEPAPVAQLEPAAWLRLAALMLGPSFAAHPAEAPTLPLTVTMPPGVAMTSMQQVQHAFTAFAATPSGKNALIKRFGRACPHERARQKLQLLSEALHRAAKGLAFAGDAWLAPDALPTLLAWRGAMNDTSWARAAEIARGCSGGRAVGADRIATWHLDTRGYLA